MNRKNIPGNNRIRAIAISGTLFLFFLDSVTPSHVLVGLLYLLPIFLSLYANQIRFTFFLTIFCIVLSIAGFFLFSGIASEWILYVNRFISVVAVVLCAHLGIEMKKAEMEFLKVAGMPAENPNPVLRIAYDQRILYVNEPGIKLLNCRTNDRISERLPESWLEAIARVVKSGEASELEHSVAKRVFSFYLTPVKSMKYINVYGADITQRKKDERQLKKLSEIDELTGIQNRRVFNQMLAQEWKRARRFRQILSLILIDIDYFKRYNDSYGHQAGDRALQKVAMILKKNVRRPADLAARYGGEEFVVLLPATSPSGAMVIAERIRMAIERKRLPHRQSEVSRWITVSIGITSTHPDHKIMDHELLNTADKALYEAKSGGRNCIILNERYAHPKPKGSKKRKGSGKTKQG